MVEWEYCFSWTSWTFGLCWERFPSYVDLEIHLGPYTYAVTVWWYR